MSVADNANASKEHLLDRCKMQEQDIKNLQKTIQEQKDKQKKLIALMTQRQEKKEKKLLEQKDIDINVLSIELSSLKEENSKQQKQIVQMSEAIHLLKKSKKNQASDFQNRIQKLQSDIDSLKAGASVDPEQSYDHAGEKEVLETKLSKAMEEIERLKAIMESKTEAESLDGESLQQALTIEKSKFEQQLHNIQDKHNAEIQKYEKLCSENLEKSRLLEEELSASDSLQSKLEQENSNLHNRLQQKLNDYEKLVQVQKLTEEASSLRETVSLSDHAAAMEKLKRSMSDRNESMAQQIQRLHMQLQEQLQVREEEKTQLQQRILLLEHHQTKSLEDLQLEKEKIHQSHKLEIEQLQQQMKELDKFSKTQEELQSSLELVEREKEKHLQELRETREKNSDLLQQVEDLQKQFQKNSVPIEELERQIQLHQNSARESMETLQQQKEVIQANAQDLKELQQLRDSLETLQKEKCGLQDLLKTKIDEIETSSASIAELQNEVDDLKNSSNSEKELHEKFTELQKETEDLRQQRADLLQTVDELHKLRESYDVLQKEKEDLQKRLQAQADEIDTSSGNIVELQNKVEVLQKDLQERTSEIQKQVESQSNAEVAADELKDRFQTLLKEKSVVEQAYKETLGQLQNLQERLQKKTNEMEICTGRISELQQSIETLKSNSNEEMRRQENTAELQIELEALQQQNAELLHARDRTIDDLQQLRDSVAALQSEKDDLLKTKADEIERSSVNIADLQKEIEILRGTSDAERKLHDELAEMQTEVEALQQQKEDLLHARDQAIDDLDQLRNSMAALQTEKDDLQTLLKTKVDEIEKSAVSIAALQKEIEVLKGDSDAEKKLHDELAGMKTEVEALQQQKEDLLHARDQAIGDLQQLRDSLEALQSEKDDLQTSLKRKTDEIERSAVNIADLQKEIEVLKGNSDAEKKLHDDVAEMKTEVEALRQQKADLLHARAQDLHDFHQLHDSMTALQSEKDDLQTLLETKADEIERSSMNITDLQNKFEVIKSSSGSEKKLHEAFADILQQQKMELEVAYQETLSQIASLGDANKERQAAATEEENNITLTKIKELEEKFIIVEQEKSELQQRHAEQLQSIESSNAELKEMRSTISELKARITKYAKLLKDSQTKKNAAEKRLGSVNAELKTLKDKILSSSDAQHRLDELQAVHSMKLLELDELKPMLETMSQQLEAAEQESI